MGTRGPPETWGRGDPEYTPCPGTQEEIQLEGQQAVGGGNPLPHSGALAKQRNAETLSKVGGTTQDHI